MFPIAAMAWSRRLRSALSSASMRWMSKVVLRAMNSGSAVYQMGAHLPRLLQTRSNHNNQATLRMQFLAGFRSGFPGVYSSDNRRQPQKELTGSFGS